MNVPKGYKMTEVGVIPENWEVRAFDDVVSLRKQRFDPRKNQNENYHFCIELENIESGTGRISGYSSLKDNASLKSIFYRNDILFGKLRAYLKKYWLADRKGVCSTEIWIFVPNTDYILASYLFQIIQSERFINEASTAYGTHMPRSDWNVVKNYPLLTPPLPEQRSIARVLSDTDELINALDKLIAKKRDIKKAVMQELLTGKTRLPGFSGEWEVKRLGDIAEMASGGTPLTSKPNYYNGEIPWVSISDMTKGGKHIFATDKYITQLGFNNSACKIFPIGTVLYAMYASLGECSIAGIPLCSSQAILGIRVKENLDNEFLYYYLNYIKNTVKGYGQQGTQPNLNKEIVQNFQIKLPFIDEQRSIAQVLSDMDREITALEQRRDKTKALKQGMMQALLTGRIRLPKEDTNDA